MIRAGTNRFFSLYCRDDFYLFFLIVSRGTEVKRAAKVTFEFNYQRSGELYRMYVYVLRRRMRILQFGKLLLGGGGDRR